MEKVAEAYQKVKNLAKSDSSDNLGNLVKGTTNGAITGGIIGLGIGFYKKWNLFGCVIAGVIAGGATSNFLIKFKNRES